MSFRKVELGDSVKLKYFKSINNTSYHYDYIEVIRSNPLSNKLIGLQENKIVKLPNYESLNNLVVIEKIVKSEKLIDSDKITKDSWVKIYKYRDHSCLEFIIESSIKPHSQEILDFVGKRVNDVVKIYPYGSTYIFAKVIDWTSNIKEQNLRREKMIKCYESGSWSEAINAVSDIENFIISAIDISDVLIDTYKKRIICYLNTARAEEALQSLKYIHDLLDDNNKYYKSIINRLLENLKQISELTSQPIYEIKDYSLFVKLGKLHKEVEAFEKAVDFYNEAVNINSNNGTAFNGLGGVLRVKGESYEAIATYKKAIEIKNNDYIAFTGLGAVYKDVGEFENAIKSYNEALKYNSKNDFAYNGLGAVFVLLNRIDEANECFGKAMRSSQQWNSAIEKLIFLNRLDKACDLLAGLLERYPYDKRAIDNKNNLIDMGMDKKIRKLGMLSR